MVKFSTGGGSDGLRSPKRSKMTEPDGSSEPPVPMADQHGGGGYAGSAKSLSATIDPDTVECNICMEPFSSPVFQCSNGHTACSSCCISMDNRCASCFQPIGQIRCLAIEKLIESLKVSCKYADDGCPEMVKYSQRNAHELYCMYAPYPCPVSGCSFFGSSVCFSGHFQSVHGASTRHFKYEAWFTVVLDITEQFHILEGEDMIFILHNIMKPLGNAVNVTCLGPKSSEAHYSYQIEIKRGRQRLIMESVPRSIVGRHKVPHDFLLVPVETYEEDGQLTFELSFHRLL
eukprot:Gb_19602 [translate_table: standard]